MDRLVEDQNLGFVADQVRQKILIIGTHSVASNLIAQLDAQMSAP
jgi:hypothetical protein